MGGGGGEYTATKKMLLELKLLKISFIIPSIVGNVSIVVYFVSIVEVTIVRIKKLEGEWG